MCAKERDALLVASAHAHPRRAHAHTRACSMLKLNSIDSEWFLVVVRDFPTFQLFFTDCSVRNAFHRCFRSIFAHFGSKSVLTTSLKQKW